MPGSESASANSTRELAAIMFSDVVGYTAIMGRDERKGLQAVANHRAHLRSILPRFNGRLIGEIGDGTLSSFHSAVDAVNCARDLQAALVEDPELRLRIGIHVGDVVFTDKTVLGDGVNIASRLNAIASPGGVCISERVYDDIRNKPEIRVKDLGEQRLKNVSRPIRAYALQAAAAGGISSTRGIPVRRTMIGAALAALAIAAVIVYRTQIMTVLRSRVPAAEATPATIAVLPFANLSASKDDEYFSDGIADEIRGDLTKVPGLQVTARTSSFAFKGHDEDVRKIAHLLSVHNVLEGSVRRSANRVRIEVELIDAVTGFTLWSDRYDERLEDVFQIQSDVAQSVVDSLRLRLMPSTRETLARAPTRNVEAYDFYLRGQHYLWDSPPNAIAAFSKATEKDPGFALAYASLARAYSWASTNTMAPRDAVPRVRTAVARALALDPNLADAHEVLAMGVLYSFDWNWPAAEAEFKRALALDSGNALIHAEYGEFLDHMGRFDEALRQDNRAHELDPLSAYAVNQIGLAYKNSRNYTRALEYFQRAIEMDPDSAVPYMCRAQVRMLQGQPQNAVPDLERARALFPGAVGLLAVAYAQASRRPDAINLLHQMQEAARNGYIDPIAFVGPYLAVGDSDQAFQWLERAVEARSYFVTALKWPEWDPVRSDPRFQAIYKKVGLPP